ncbi:MAG: hypothetical protein M1819_001895 [Sarea resinae]|nr:MAG: hypothetical protein M1819_001895 [Sarea resinae]
MVASLRPSLRSSTRHAERFATAPPKNIPSTIRRAKKRPRSDSIDEEDPQAAKKVRLATQLQNRQKTVARRKDPKKAKPPANKPLTQGILTQPEIDWRTTNGVQKQSNTTKHSLKRARVAAPRAQQEKNEQLQRANVPKPEKRTLRSQDGGSRFKSDLSLYFPGYEEIIAGEPKESEFLTLDTPIFIVDEPTKELGLKPDVSSGISNPVAVKKRRITFDESGNTEPGPGTLASENISSTLTNAQKIDFSSIEKHARQSSEDPLGDELYYKLHRRAERQEKQLRNIEKDHAQHEKLHLERLLDGLKGPDWLRVMGINGITETEKKVYEPKRDMFIGEVQALVDKFRIWKEEEKRRKVQKDKALLQRESSGGKVMQSTETTVPRKVSTPDSSDLDAWAARQLHQEAISAKGASIAGGSDSDHLEPPKKKSKRTEPEQPFTSFYSKPYLRAAAIGKHRRGRTRTAFGHPIPDVSPRDFYLPDDVHPQGKAGEQFRMGSQCKTI